MNFFSVIENFMLKTNSMRPVISFTNLLPYLSVPSTLHYDEEG
jgi:hypothetical protein